MGYFDSFIETGSLHIVMEWCNRGDLQALVKKAKAKDIACLKEHVTWNLGLQVILGLHYLHEKHILHRDLKSANVFLQKDAKQQYFSVKIGDLGVAKLLETSTAFAQTIVGTPYYLSPELVADQPYRDKSDCWALGVLLYECCTLCHPFEARNQCALIMKIMQSPVKPPPEATVSPQLSRFILWLLQKDPNKRPRIRDILLETYIQEKLKEHGFELPAELIGEEAVLSVLDSEVVIDREARYRHVGDELGDDNDNTIDNNRDNYKDKERNGERDRDEDNDYKSDFHRHDEADGTHSPRGNAINNSNSRPGGLSSSIRDGTNKTHSDEHVAVTNTGSEEKQAAQYNYNSQGSSDSDHTPGTTTRTSTTQRASTGGAVPSRLQQRAINNTVQIRGNRVRGGVNAERSTSSKVLTRHQVQVPPRANTGSTGTSAGAGSGTGKINAVSSGTDDFHSPNPAHPAESKQAQELGADSTVDDLGRSFKANELTTTLAAARKTNAENSTGNAVVIPPFDIADSKDASNTTASNMLNRSFKEIDIDLAETKIKLSNGGVVSSTPRKQEIEPDVLYAPDFETTVAVTKTPRYEANEAKGSAKDVYEHTNDATINQQVGILSRKPSSRTNTHADAVSHVAAEYVSRVVSHNTGRGAAAAADDLEDTVVTTVEVVNGLGNIIGNDEVQDDIKVASGGGTTDSSTQSTMNTVNTVLSKGSNGLSGPLAEAHANAHLPARERRESCDAAYEDDFEDYDDELINLYQPVKEVEQKHDDQEYGEDDDHEDGGDDDDEEQNQPLSAEYLAHFGGAGASANVAAKGAQPKAGSKVEEDEFKASLRQELKLDSKDAAGAGGDGRASGGNDQGGDEANNSDHMSNDSLDDDPFEARREIDEMLYWIADTREILTKSLGVELFQSIYSLCKDNMTEHLDGSTGNKDVGYLHEIQKKLQDHLHASLEAVLGTVMQVKALLAWEEELARKNLATGQGSDAVNFLKEF